MPLRLLLPNIRIHHACYIYIFHPVASLRLRCSIIDAIIVESVHRYIRFTPFFTPAFRVTTIHLALVSFQIFFSSSSSSRLRKRIF